MIKLDNSEMKNRQNRFTLGELVGIYQIIRAYQEGLITNPQKEWELDHYDSSLINKRHFKAILKKIENILPENEKTEIIKHILQRKYSSFNNEIDEKVYSEIEKAFGNLKTIEIEYFNMDSAKTIKRLIDVYHKTRKYVIGYCHLRGDIRKFRTSRIVSASLTDKKYKVPENFNKNEF